MHLASPYLTENIALLDHIKSSKVTPLTETKRLPKLSALLTRINAGSSVLTSTLDKKHLYKWDGIMNVTRS